MAIWGVIFWNFFGNVKQWPPFSIVQFSRVRCVFLLLFTIFSGVWKVFNMYQILCDRVCLFVYFWVTVLCLYNAFYLLITVKSRFQPVVLINSTVVGWFINLLALNNKSSHGTKVCGLQFCISFWLGKS